MALGWSEIRSRAATFAYEWRDQGSEKGQSQTFWIEFFEVFGISQKRVAVFEKKVKKIGGDAGFIDMLWKGVLLIEQKSAGKDLTKAYKQATEYFPGLTDDELPRFILVCNFEKFHLYDLTGGTDIEFALNELPSKVELFGFMIGFAWEKPTESEKVSIAAAEKMAKLHDSLKSINYTGRKLEQYLVRLLFCLFADDTGIFDKNIFRDLIAGTKLDGSDLAQVLADLFSRLNTPPSERLKIEDKLSSFPYVNGGLFADTLPIAAFDSQMRKALLDSCSFDWGFITPSIFGSMFQAAMSEEQRREMGAHYTEESNILKAINPLFMDDLNTEFELIKSNTKKLQAFHDKLARLKFLDPACGTGNFLIIAYRELRRLEMRVLEAIYTIGSAQGASIQMALDVRDRSKIDVDQFYGIEIDEFACEIARVGLWLMDHQCNMELSKAFGGYYVRLPLDKSAVICHSNALTIDWNAVCPANELSYILGNPPFWGARLMSEEQKADLVAVIVDSSGKPIKGTGNLDYVSAWYYKATQFIQQNMQMRVALVSTNSITQGDQVALMWKSLIEDYNVKIDFAYRTFHWTSAARGKAAVHCVVVGFSRDDVQTKRRIFDGDLEIVANNINPYLVDAPNVYVENRRKPLCDVPNMIFGNMPNDGGHFLFTDDEKSGFIEKEPDATKWFRLFSGSEEFINKISRWCLWLEGISPSELHKLPMVRECVAKVRKLRSESSREATRKLAEYPTLFGEVRQPNSDYLLVPAHSSENRTYIPIGFMSKNVIASNACLIVPNTTVYHFGILTSNIHMAWVRTVCGRLKSDYRYSAGIVYNNFPWPMPTDKQRLAVETAAQAVLDARAQYPNESLAKLYDPTLMPAVLAKAHKSLDNAVKNAYGSKGFASEAERVTDLMERYRGLVAGGEK
ncbi:MAG: class I SAM-dependent DNA methyltransferase [Chitinispirillia bacterium]|nr:class I SAM-dependent DNA methyltransferase [Chitinispirillia bacterium]